MLSPGDVFAGYTVVGLLGSGGMGEVYLVDSLELRRREALKIIRAGSGDSIALARFRKEAQLIAALDHPSIVTVYAIGVVGDDPWFTMRYVPGVDLVGAGVSSPAVVGRVLLDAGSALDYAHGRGVTHRDVKPANISVGMGRDGQVASVCVLDFGVARLAGETRLTVSNAFLGSMAYAAPEAFTSTDVTGRADQYSLACSAFEMLTGSRPFTADTAPALMQQHLAAEPPLVSTLDRRLRGYDAVFARALDKDPSARFSNCREFAAAFVSVGGGVSVSADRPAARLPAPGVVPNSAQPSRRAWFRAHAKQFGVTAAVAVLLGVGGLAYAMTNRETPGDHGPAAEIPLPNRSAMGEIDFSGDIQRFKIGTEGFGFTSTDGRVACVLGGERFWCGPQTPDGYNWADILPCETGAATNTSVGIDFADQGAKFCGVSSYQSSSGDVIRPSGDGWTPALKPLPDGEGVQSNWIGSWKCASRGIRIDCYNTQRQRGLSISAEIVEDFASA
ncbi:serine/threonine-protein kinase [Gordonia malaquae]|uniref:serine/threonine-protein kinase n=1 Tax=Gordonia malaquae TaxID=410332 RepID=UPI0012FB424A|nr:serine/threonine-protein kinase [Gordonia malaquae]